MYLLYQKKKKLHWPFETVCFEPYDAITYELSLQCHNDLVLCSEVTMFVLVVQAKRKIHITAYTRYQ